MHYSSMGDRVSRILWAVVAWMLLVDNCMGALLQWQGGALPYQSEISGEYNRYEAQDRTLQVGHFRGREAIKSSYILPQYLFNNSECLC